MTTTHHHQLESMAWTIDRHGIDAVPAAALRELGFEARDLGVRPGLTDLLADAGVPTVVRNRAFGFIAATLARRSGASTDTTITSEQVACAA